MVPPAGGGLHAAGATRYSGKASGSHRDNPSRAHATVTAGPNTPLDRRMALLEEKFAHLWRQIDETENAIRKELRTITQTVSQEEQTRTIEDRRINRKIEEVAVGGLRLEFVGLFWLMLGVVGTSIPKQLAEMLSFVLPV